MAKIEDRYWIELDSFVHSSHSTKSDTTSGIKGTAHPYIHGRIHETLIILVFHVLKSFQMGKLFVVNLILYTLLSTLTVL